MTIGEILQRTSQDFQDKGIQIRDRSGRRSDRRTYPELLQLIERYCGHWRAAGIVKGDRVLLCLNTSWDFIGAWLGAICIGAYPAAIAPAVGGLKGSNHFADRLEKFRQVIGSFASAYFRADGGGLKKIVSRFAWRHSDNYRGVIEIRERKQSL